MPIKINDVDKFVTALQEEKAVNFTSKGEWYIEGGCMRFIRWIFCLKEARLSHVAKVVAKYLETMEAQEVYFDGSLAAKKTGYSDPLKIAKAVSQALKASSSAKVTAAYHLLKRQIVGLKYRIEYSNGGKDPLPSADAFTINKVILIAREWKKKQEIFKVDPTLHSLDEEKIASLCSYGSFVKLFLKDKNLQEEVFSWIIRTCNPVDPLVQFPGRCKRIKAALLNGRIGRFAYANVLSIKKSETKTLTLPFEGKPVSILDETKKITFSQGNYTVTIQDIFTDMKNKNKKQGDFEFIGAKGFCNWRSDDWSYYDTDQKKWIQIDLTQKEWWNDPHLPEFETITAEEVERQYGVKPKNGEWVIMAMATRQSHRMMIDDCHGYEQVLIPDGKGSFRIHVFGKYADKWPTGLFGKLGFLVNTNKAKFFYSDPSPSYSGFRQQAAAPFIVTEEQGLQEMERIRGYAERSREGNVVFMFPWENCAYFPQTGLEALLGKEAEGGQVPNLYRTHLLTASGSKPINYCFSFTNKFPKKLHYAIVRMFEFIFGSYRGLEIVEEGKKVVKSASTSQFRTGYTIKSPDGKVETFVHHIFLPSFLHEQILAKTLGRGVIWAGHQHTQKTAIPTEKKNVLKYH